ncbi:hypothetical protein BFW38_17130 [Terasakiispira papahanaumokuakeensis]|uniref:DUF2971 domain-containing protein n=1 Tax=Terasakiispira papahanaumokuakeensis TaxID=197479 RepID=A0A1E2VDG3_9GAMM|nr:DUF2971 domain-containing protein [Terasakiispira papahanaumokuakeensis]ODC05004.1 hypothetical protein BFW38_17130 [Terasakiispira papahanaumokuakeensis]
MSSGVVWTDQLYELFMSSHLDQALQLVKENRPEFLYRYRSGTENDLDALLNGYEWMSFPSDYNDVYDSSLFFNEEYIVNSLSDFMMRRCLSLDKFPPPVVKYIESCEGGNLVEKIISAASNKRLSLGNIDVDSVVAQHNSILDLNKRKFHEAKEFLKSRVKTCSFSTVMNSAYMWAVYAGSGSGYCAKYSINDQDLSFSDSGLFPMIYREEELDFTNFICDFIRSGSFRSGAFLLASSVKHSNWMPEGEWRVIRSGECSSHYLKEIYLESVFLGMNASEDLVYKVVDICNKKGVPVHQVVVNSSKFNDFDTKRLN